jgi:hypothetical protein
LPEIAFIAGFNVAIQRNTRYSGAMPLLIKRILIGNEAGAFGNGGA